MIALQQQLDALESTVQSLLPCGTIVAWAGNPDNIPAGWLLCDGSIIDPETDLPLYRAMSTRFDHLEPKRSYVLPDLRGRTIIGPDADSSKVGTMMGAESKTLTTAELPSHSHSVVDGRHSHSFKCYNWAPKEFGYPMEQRNKGEVLPQYICINDTHSNWAAHTFTTSTAGSDSTEKTGDGKAFSIIQPSLVISYIIKR